MTPEKKKRLTAMLEFPDEHSWGAWHEAIKEALDEEPSVLLPAKRRDQIEEMAVIRTLRQRFRLQTGEIVTREVQRPGRVSTALEYAAALKDLVEPSAGPRSKAA